VRRLRRFIFDSIGPEARRAGGSAIPRPKWTDQQRTDRGADLAALTDTLVAFASLSPDAYVYRFGERVIGSKDAILGLGSRPSDPRTLDQAAIGLSYRTLEMFAAIRTSTMDPELALVEPQIMRRIIRSVPDANAARFDVQLFSDLAWNRLAPVSGVPNATAIVTQGVLDTLQESAIVFSAEPLHPAQTTAALFEEAARQRIEIIALNDVNDVRLSGFPGPARARMLQDLTAGQVLVTPGRSVTVDGQPRVGWWRVDPTSGHVVGAMDTGLLQAYVDYYVPTVTVTGVVILKFHRLPLGNAAHTWARHMMNPVSTTMSQWNNLLRLAQEAINRTGQTPPL
jgi:hypothetical protein